MCLLLGAAATFAPLVSAQTPGGRWTADEIATISAAQAQAAIDGIPEPGSALLWQNSAVGTAIVLPADDTVLTHWKTAQGAASHILGTDINPPLDDGDTVEITRGGRYLVFVTVTVKANPQVDFSVYISEDKKKIPGVKAMADGTIATKHTVSIASFADLPIGKRVRVSFSSPTGGTLTVFDVNLLVAWIGPEVNP